MSKQKESELARLERLVRQLRRENASLRSELEQMRSLDGDQRDSDSVSLTAEERSVLLARHSSW